MRRCTAGRLARTHGRRFWGSARGSDKPPHRPRTRHIFCGIDVPKHGIRGRRQLQVCQDRIIDFIVAVRARSLPSIVLASLHLLQTGDAYSQQCIQTSPVVNKRQIIIAAWKTSHAAQCQQTQQFKNSQNFQSLTESKHDIQTQYATTNTIRSPTHEHRTILHWHIRRKHRIRCLNLQCCITNLMHT